MRLLFVTPEITPYTGSSPLGDCCAALPKALAQRGHDVTVVTPLYGFVDPVAKGLGRRLRKVKTGKDGVDFTVFDAKTAAGVDLIFLGSEALFTPVTSLGGRDEADGERYAAFARAAVTLLEDAKGGEYDAVHCHGWQAALVPAFVEALDLDVSTVLTVHDASSNRAFDASCVDGLGLDAAGDTLRFLDLGLAAADRITTVSTTYASEVAQGTGGVAKYFRERRSEVRGIIGGVDVAVWNPATDAYLASRYDAMDAAGKVRCKAQLQDELGLPVRDDVPLFVAIGAIDASSGFDVLARVMSRLLRADVQVAVLGLGEADKRLLAVLEEHAGRWPDRLTVHADVDAGLEHRGLSGADAVLVPPDAAPGESIQLRAQRYGALPVGPRAGSVADGVVDCDAALRTGNGFLYGAGRDSELVAAAQRAITSFENKNAFEATRERAMRGDHGWDSAAYLYDQIYAAR